MTPTRQLARLAATITLEEIPVAVRHQACLVMLDGLGCALAAAALKQSQGMIKGTISAGGKGPCRVVGTPQRVNPASAAFINAKLGNLMDMDDVWRNIGHQSPVVLYPALAEGEARRRNGAEVLLAFIVGFEVASRVVASLGSLFNVKEGKASPSHLTGFGQAIFGGAAAGGRLARLDEDRMLHALGIAGLYSPASLSHKSVMNMSMSKYQIDLAAMGAVMAVRQAEMDVTGCTTILDDDLYARAMGKTGYWPEFISQGLGEKWAVAETSIKPYPHCRHTHYALDLLAELMEKHQIQPGEIEAMEIMGLRNYLVHPWTVAAPDDIFQAQFSLPCAMALVALGVEPGPAWMDQRLITSSPVRELAARVSATENPQIIESMIKSYPRPEVRLPTKVTVKTARGQFEAEKAYARGDQFESSQRLNPEQILSKFKRNSTAILNQGHQERVIDTVLGMEKTRSIRSLMDLLAP